MADHDGCVWYVVWSRCCLLLLLYREASPTAIWSSEFVVLTKCSLSSSSSSIVSHVDVLLFDGSVAVSAIMYVAPSSMITTAQVLIPFHAKKVRSRALHCTALRCIAHHVDPRLATNPTNMES